MRARAIAFVTDRATVCPCAAVLSPRNYDKKSRESAASLIPMFRDYLHYHIKCSKAYLVRAHARARVHAAGRGRGRSRWRC